MKLNTVTVPTYPNIRKAILAVATAAKGVPAAKRDAIAQRIYTSLVLHSSATEKEFQELETELSTFTQEQIEWLAANHIEPRVQCSPLTRIFFEETVDEM